MIYCYPSAPPFTTILNLNDLHFYFMVNKRNNKHIDGIDDYFDRWKKVLFETYNREKKTTFKFTNHRNFYTKINLPNSNIRIHFDVNKAISLAKNLLIQRIPLYAFSESDDGVATIKYTSVFLDRKYDYQHCEEPVIVIPYNHGGFGYLVIDGNHRVTSYKKNCKEKIKVNLLNIERIIPLIASNFEKALYFLIFEAEDFSSYIDNSASQYFINGEFCFG